MDYMIKVCMLYPVRYVGEVDNFISTPITESNGTPIGTHRAVMELLQQLRLNFPPLPSIPHKRVVVILAIFGPVSYIS